MKTATDPKHTPSGTFAGYEQATANYQPSRTVLAVVQDKHLTERGFWILLIYDVSESHLLMNYDKSRLVKKTVGSHPKNKNHYNVAKDRQVRYSGTRQER